jgi:hypothetical protein
LPTDFREFIDTDRPELDAVRVYANFVEHYPEAERTLKLWRKWVRREHASTGQPSTKGQQAQPITVPGREGRDPVLVQLEADRAKAVPPPAAVRERIKALARKAEGASA